MRFGDYAVEVIVVDNASADDSTPMVHRDFAWAKLIENEPNIGFMRANNQGIRASSGRYVLLLNSDTEVKPGTLQTLCQPTLTPRREFWRLTFLDNVWRRSTYNMARWTSPEPYGLEVIKGAYMMLRRAALDRIGQIDEQYFMYTKKVDHCYRLMQDGWTLHCLPRAEAIRYGEASSKQIAERMYGQLYRSKVQFYRKFGGAQRGRRFKQLVMAAYVPRLIAAKLITPLLPAYAARVTTFSQLLAELPRM